MFGSIATMRPSRAAMSTSLRPSGSVVPRTIRSKVMARRSPPQMRLCSNMSVGENLEFPTGFAQALSPSGSHQFYSQFAAHDFRRSIHHVEGHADIVGIEDAVDLRA